ncbi:MAG TPA: hypothetical protein VLF67_01965 [Candidatus Saccharimonas sp.]|nr:hypothetical protein [Candidatus Saccharimonas sp.]
MKRLLTALALGLTIAAAPLSQVAASTTTVALNNLKTKGAAEIDRRLTALNSVLTITIGAKTLTDQIQAEITSLTALKTKLAADTKLSTARTDVQSIVTEYRVYALMLPKVRLINLSDRFDGIGRKFVELHDKLQTKVADAKSAGHDVAALQTALDDMKAKLDAAAAVYAGVADKVLALQPTDYNSDHAVLLQYRENYADARTDYKAAHDDAKTVIDGLKALK